MIRHFVILHQWCVRIKWYWSLDGWLKWFHSSTQALSSSELSIMKSFQFKIIIIIKLDIKNRVNDLPPMCALKSTVLAETDRGSLHVYSFIFTFVDDDQNRLITNHNAIFNRYIVSCLPFHINITHLLFYRSFQLILSLSYFLLLRCVQNWKTWMNHYRFQPNMFSTFHNFCKRLMQLILLIIFI